MIVQCNDKSPTGHLDLDALQVHSVTGRASLWD